MEYMMNLENQKGQNNSRKSSNTEKKNNYPHTPQPSMKNISNDMTKIIENEISQIGDFSKNQEKKKDICGGAASGKSKITNYFQSKIPNSIVVCEKDFFNSESCFTRKKSVSEYLKDRFAVTDDDGYSLERKTRIVDLSNPQCFNWDELVNVMNKISKKQPATISFYDQDEDIIIKDFTKIDENVSIVFVEGQFIFRDQRIRDMFDMKIFVEVDADVRLSRLAMMENIHIKDNVNAYKSFFIIYEKYMKNAFEGIVENSKKYANLILPNFSVNQEDELNSDPTLEFIILNMQNLLKKK